MQVTFEYNNYKSDSRVKKRRKNMATIHDRLKLETTGYNDFKRKTETKTRRAD